MMKAGSAVGTAESYTSSLAFSVPSGTGSGKGHMPGAEAPGSLCAEHVRQLGGESPLLNLVEVKS